MSSAQRDNTGFKCPYLLDSRYQSNLMIQYFLCQFPEKSFK